MESAHYFREQESGNKAAFRKSTRYPAMTTGVVRSETISEGALQEIDADTKRETTRKAAQTRGEQ